MNWRCTMDCKHQTLIFLFSALFITGCSEDCRTVSSVHPVYFNAVVYPESFDAYVQNNKSAFDKDFLSCLDDKISVAEKNAENERQLCDDTFVQGSDFWNACYDDIGPQHLFIAYLSAIRIVTTPGASLNFSQTETGAYLIISKQVIGAREYESLMSGIVSLLEEGMECEYCEKRFFLF